MNIPDLALTHGQVVSVLWNPTVVRHAKPRADFLAKLNHLRSAGIPFAEHERPAGPGTNLVYTFDHLAEITFAFELLDHGCKPRDVVDIIRGRRRKLRAMFREAYEHRSEVYLVPLGAEEKTELIGQGLFMECTIAYNRMNPTVRGLKLLTPVETAKLFVFPESGLSSRFIVAISNLLEQTISRAMQAPEIRRGRPANVSARASEND